MSSTDFIEFLADDPATSVLVVYTEQVRRPREFLDAIRRCRAAGKPVVLMFPGRSAKSKQAAQSHTGALVGDYATMRTLVEDAGAIVVTTMDEMMDLAEILVRYPKPPVKGPGILTASGAFVGLSNDMAEELGFEFPAVEPATLKIFEDTLPPYGNYGNPLDATAGFTPTSLPAVVKALIDDPNIGMLFISFPINTGLVVQNFNKGMEGSDKPKVMVALGDTWPLGPDVMEAVKQSPAVFGRSSDRMMRAIATYTALRQTARARPNRRKAGADQGPAQARQGRAAGVARQEGARRRRHQGPRRRTRPHGGRRGRGRQTHRLSGGVEGPGRGAVAQDRGRRRHAEPCRRSGTPRRLGHA